MNKHEPYLVFPRTLKGRKGKPIYYYQYRKADGLLSNARSTGQTSRTAAVRYVEDLIVKGGVIIEGNLRFHEFCRSFFGDDSPWVRDRLAIGTKDKPAIGEKQIVKYRGFAINYFIKYIPNNSLDIFSPSDIKEFRLKLLENSGLSRKSINDVMSCLRIMFNSALNDGLIPRNPFRGISPLITEPKPRDAFSMDHMKIIMKYEWKNPDVRLFILVAALTGMRLSEVNSLRRSNIMEDYIDLQDQYRNGNLMPSKTRHARKIPICKELHDMLVTHIPEGKDFVFDCLPDDKASDDLREMLIKIMPEERIKHGYCFHSLRHFANTYYLDKGILPIKVAAVMGHSTGVSSMQERYTNFTPENYKEFYAVQAELLDILTH